MSDLVAEAEKVNAARTPGPWVHQPEKTEWESCGLCDVCVGDDESTELEQCRKPEQVTPSWVDGPFTVDSDEFHGLNEADAAFIAFCGTHMGTLLSILASEGEKVKAMKDWLHTSFNMAMPGGPLVCPVCEQPEAKGHAPDCNAAMFALDARRSLEADRDRLAAEVERLTVDIETLSDALANTTEIERWQERAEKAEAEAARLTAEVAELKDTLTAESDGLTEMRAERNRLRARWEALKAWTSKLMQAKRDAQAKAEGTYTEPTPPPAVGRCKTCRHFIRDGRLSACQGEVVQLFVPADGSGFCHLWEAAE